MTKLITRQLAQLLGLVLLIMTGYTERVKGGVDVQD